jgi:hypothetical protein
MKKTNTSETAALVSRLDEHMKFQEQIAERAYELWQQRGCAHGYDLADWFQAEIEIKERYRQQIFSPC